MASLFQLILQCTTGNSIMNGTVCCNTIFNPAPYITPYGSLDARLFCQNESGLKPTRPLKLNQPC